MSTNIIGFSSGIDHSTSNSKTGYDMLNAVANMTGVPATQANFCFFGSPAQREGASGAAWPTMPNSNGKRSYGDPIFTW